MKSLDVLVEKFCKLASDEFDSPPPEVPDVVPESYFGDSKPKVDYMDQFKANLHQEKPPEKKLYDRKIETPEGVKPEVEKDLTPKDAFTLKKTLIWAKNNISQSEYKKNKDNFEALENKLNRIISPNQDSWERDPNWKPAQTRVNGQAWDMYHLGIGPKPEGEEFK